MTNSKCILISGAAGGIGRATVRALSESNFTVFAGVLNANEAALLAGDGFQRVIPVTLDVSNEESIAVALNTVAEQMSSGGTLCGLINNAGVNYNAPLQYLSVAEIRQTMDVNLLGSILLTRAAIPLLRQNQSRVVFTGSATGFMAPPIISTYAATKFGVEGFADGLRLEFRPLGIQVSVIEPGVVRTPMTAAAPDILEVMLGRMSSGDRTLFENAMRKIAHMSSAPTVGIPADKVAKAILHALTAPFPKARYQVGVDSKIASWACHLPDSVRDFIQRITFGI